MRAVVLWAAVLGVVAVAIVLRPVLERRGKNRPRFAYSRQPLSREEYAHLGARPGWTTRDLPVSDGATLSGLIRRPKEPDKSEWVLFFPGNDRTQLARGQRVLESLRGEHDYGLAVFAYRGFDASTGKASPAALAADGLRIFDTLIKEEHADPSRVHVVAFSLGGYVACSTLVAAAKARRHVASLSLLASVGNVEMNASGLAARVSVGDVYEALPLLPDVPGPVLVVQGTADEALPLETSHNIAQILGNRATRVEIPGAAHELGDDERALEHVRKMIESSRQR